MNGTSKYQGYINFPTTYGAILNRYLLKNNLTDPQVVYALQNQSSILEVNRTDESNDNAPLLSLSLFDNLTSTSTIKQQLTALARVAPYNPPEVVANQLTINKTFALAGLQNGTYIPPSDVNFTAAVITQNQTFRTKIFFPVNNGWTEQLRPNQGDFHADYISRAIIAFDGYLQLTPEEALYPSINGTASLRLSKDDAYLFTFSSKPPVNGFWSLTAYGVDQYLIPNPLNRASLGDRSNLTYPDGKLVYDVDGDEKGVFQVLVQAADVAPPGNWTNKYV